MSVVLLGEYPPLVEEELYRYGLSYKVAKTEEDFLIYLKEASAILVGEGMSLPPSFYEQTTKVKVLASLLEGAENIDLKRATRIGIPVIAPNRGIAPSVADYIFARLLESTRLKNLSPKVELKGKTLGILGWNETAQELAVRAKAFGLRLLAHEITLSQGRASAFDVSLTDKASLFAHSDYLCILKNYDEKSEKIVSRELLRLLSPKASLLYFTDLRLANLEDMIRGLSWGEYAHLTIDFSFSNQEAYNLLKTFPNASVSLAEAGNTKEAHIGIAKEMVKDIARTLGGKLTDSTLNIPQIALKNQKDMALYGKFFHFMGELSSARFNALPQKIELLFEGDWIKLDEIPLAHYFLEGLARGIKELSVNHINAKLWALEKGVGLSFMHGDKRGSECLVVRLYHEGEVYEIIARMLGSQWQILGWDDYQFIAEPTKHLLILPHANCPGMVGKVGTLIGERKINIGGMVLGHSPTDINRAMMWIRLDSPPSGDLLDELKEMPDIFEAVYIYSDCVKGMDNDVRSKMD